MFARHPAGADPRSALRVPAALAKGPGLREHAAGGNDPAREAIMAEGSEGQLAGKVAAITGGDPGRG